MYLYFVSDIAYGDDMSCSCATLWYDRLVNALFLDCRTCLMFDPSKYEAENWYMLWGINNIFDNENYMMKVVTEYGVSNGWVIMQKAKIRRVYMFKYLFVYQYVYIYI